jgi:hypothetical protein
MRSLLAAASALLCALSAGAAAGDDPPPAGERRDLPAFDALRSAGAIDVVVTVGPAQSVVVRVAPDLQPLVTTRVEDGALFIHTDRRFRNGRLARIEVSVPALRALSIEGSGDATVTGARGPFQLGLDGSGDVRWSGEATTLEIAMRGTGDVALAGRARAVRIRVDGTGDVDATGLRTVDADVLVNGTGDVDVTLDGGHLTAASFGTGDIHWRGQTASEHALSRGTGDVARR